MSIYLDARAPAIEVQLNLPEWWFQAAVAAVVGRRRQRTPRTPADESGDRSDREVLQTARRPGHHAGSSRVWHPVSH